MKNSLIIASAYIAAVIGAGFASGAEVTSFFLKYGKISFFGIALASALFGGIAWLILRDCVKGSITEFDDYLSYLMPKAVVRITKIVVILFMAVSVSAMAAAAGEVLFDLWGLRQMIGAFIFTVVCTAVLHFSVYWITKINSVLGIVIGAGIVLSCLYIVNFRLDAAMKPIGGWVFSSITYTAYNGISAAVILCGMSRFIRSKKQAMLCGIISGVGIFVILTSLWCVVGIYYGKVNLGEIPMLSIAVRQSRVFYIIYSVILFLAVFTTAIANGYGLKAFLEKHLPEYIYLPFIAVVTIFISGIGFGSIVDVVYRLCGYASLILPIYMIINEVKQRK